MAKKYRVTLTDAEREELAGVIRRRSETALPVKRAYALLAADENGDKCWKDTHIGETYTMGLRTIERLRQRVVEEGLHIAVWGKKREVFKEKVLDGHVEARLVALRCRRPPSGYARWSLRLLADKMVELEYVEQISHESVRQILNENELKPWLVKSWVIPEAGPDFVCAMEEVLDVYAQPYDPKYPKVC